jgi:hypothetical protein
LGVVVVVVVVVVVDDVEAEEALFLAVKASWSRIEASIA